MRREIAIEADRVKEASRTRCQSARRAEIPSPVPIRETVVLLNPRANRPAERATVTIAYGGIRGFGETGVANPTAQDRAWRSLLACTTRDCDAGKMAALRVRDDFAP